MSKTTTSKPAKTFAPIAPDVARKAITALVKVATDDAKAGMSRLAQVQACVAPFGPLTAAQWDAQIKPGLVAALEKSKVKNPGVYASKFKTAGLALASGLPAFKANGRTLRDYLADIAAPLRTAVLKDGRPIMAANTGGRKPTTAAEKAKAKKAKAEAKNAEAAKGSAGISKDAEGGHDVSRYHAMAVSLMGSEAGGTLLLAILKDHRADFDAWAKDRVAKAKPATPKAPAAPKAPPKVDAKDKALNAELMAMASKTEPKAKANGAVN
jgi:hypothetical protein